MFLFIYLIFSLLQETKKKQVFFRCGLKILQIHVWGLEVGTYVHALSFQVWLSFKKLVSSHKLLTARHRTLCSLGLDEHGLSRSYFWTRSDESSCFLHPCHHLESDDTMNAWAQMLVCVTKKNSSCWFHLRNVKVWIKWTAVLMNACWAVCSCRGHFVSDLQTVTINYWKWLRRQRRQFLLLLWQLLVGWWIRFEQREQHDFSKYVMNYVWTLRPFHTEPVQNRSLIWKFGARSV